jgi:MoaA/NifB/PqqE/SkfB family radical SAM enzyme
MKNLLETLEKLGFKPDYPNNHLSLYLDNAETKKEGKYAVIRISDNACDSIPNAESKGLVISINIENKEGKILEYFSRSIGE